MNQMYTNQSSWTKNIKTLKFKDQKVCFTFGLTLNLQGSYKLLNNEIDELT
ncbi:hypothetical protein Syun_017393 [Stephania yunnanensis]|uniref:Uncharacterized protein n=1 Tax=Stephania yunnanensis TaxID=152371 RepID=A0AAP0J936_9MAGN